MCITTLANTRNKKPLSPWQRFRQGLGFVGMLLWMLASGLAQKIRQG